MSRAHHPIETRARARASPISRRRPGLPILAAGAPAAGPPDSRGGACLAAGRRAGALPPGK